MPIFLPPLKFKPVLLSKPWGGEGLWKTLGKGNSDDLKMGEAWELSDRPEASTKVVGGAFDGVDFHELITQHSGEIFGKAPPQNNFPLLYKFICALEKLSVQVHPGMNSPLGESKTECWVIVDAKPGAELIVGVDSKGRSRQEVLGLLKSSDCEQVLKRWSAKRGDVFFIPAGTVHAITEGLVLYEVQQNSDTTFRLYDWGRVDAKGQPRALHIEEASQVADLEDRDGYKIRPLVLNAGTHSEDYLVACAYFVLVKWHRFQSPARMKTRGHFVVLSVISGSFVLRSETPQTQGEFKEVLSMIVGDTILIPACCSEFQLEAVSSDAEVIASFVPDWNSDIVEPLRKAGYRDEQIQRLQGPPGIRF